MNVTNLLLFINFITISTGPIMMKFNRTVVYILRKNSIYIPKEVK